MTVAIINLKVDHHGNGKLYQRFDYLEDAHEYVEKLREVSKIVDLHNILSIVIQTEGQESEVHLFD